MATLLVEDGIFLKHLVPTTHPERPDRLIAISRALADPQFAPLVRRTAPLADAEVLTYTHAEHYVDEVRHAVPQSGLAQLDPDTYVSPESYTVALHAVGGALMAVDEVVSKRVANAFCAVRPPGHHARPEHAMGFCLFNSAAIAARHAQRKHGQERVAIVDWDVHHGNGTQEIFWSDTSVLYCSTHQMPLYPGTGYPSETGVANNIVNCRLAPGDDGKPFRALIGDRILPAIDAFKPDMIIISCGFDAHYLDPLASINLTEDDFAWATRVVMEAADRHAGGRLVSLLEGGYDLAGLANSTAVHVAELMKAGG
jgi:acetoin utilization deacetylase AcuC-like enzyme